MKIQYKYALLITWMFVIFLLSNEVSRVSSERSSAIVDIVTSIGGSLPQDVLTFLTRKAAHIIAYFILGILMYWVVRSYDLRTRKAVLLSIALVVTYAVSDEVHQLFVSGRSGEVRDVLIDTTAGSVGVGLSYLVVSRKAGKITQKSV